MDAPPTYLDIEQQIALLKKRGMTFGNEAQVWRILERVGYFRLSGYWQQYLPADKSHFVSCIAFDDILADYGGRPLFLLDAGFPELWRQEPFWAADNLPTNPRTH